MTRRRMYLEAYADFIGRIDRLLVMDEKQRNFLPFLDMAKMPAKRKAAEGGQADTPLQLVPFDREEKQ